MKLDIKFDIFSVLWIFIICLTLFLSLVLLVSHSSDYYEYNKYISDNMKNNIDFYYSCDDSFNSVMYNCPKTLQYKNLTGYYCNKTKICENSYKIK